MSEVKKVKNLFQFFRLPLYMIDGVLLQQSFLVSWSSICYLLILAPILSVFSSEKCILCQCVHGCYKRSLLSFTVVTSGCQSVTSTGYQSITSSVPVVTGQ